MIKEKMKKAIILIFSIIAIVFGVIFNKNAGDIMVKYISFSILSYGISAFLYSTLYFIYYGIISKKANKLIEKIIIVFLCLFELLSYYLPILIFSWSFFIVGKKYSANMPFIILIIIMIIILLINLIKKIYNKLKTI